MPPPTKLLEAVKMTTKLPTFVTIDRVLIQRLFINWRKLRQYSGVNLVKEQENDALLTVCGNRLSDCMFQLLRNTTILITNRVVHFAHCISSWSITRF